MWWNNIHLQSWITVVFQYRIITFSLIVVSLLTNSTLIKESIWYIIFSSKMAAIFLLVFWNELRNKYIQLFFFFLWCFFRSRNIFGSPEWKVFSVIHMLETCCCYFSGQILSVLCFFVNVLLDAAHSGHCTRKATMEKITVIRCNYRQPLEKGWNKIVITQSNRIEIWLISAKAPPAAECVGFSYLF